MMNADLSPSVGEPQESNFLVAFLFFIQEVPSEDHFDSKNHVTI